MRSASSEGVEFRDFFGRDVTDLRFEFGGLTLVFGDGGEVFVSRRFLGRLGRFLGCDIRSTPPETLLKRIRDADPVFSCNLTKRGFWWCYRLTSKLYRPVRHRDVFTVTETVLLEHGVRIKKKKFIKFMRRSAMLYVLGRVEGGWDLGLVVSNANTGGDAIHVYGVVVSEGGDFIDYGVISTYVAVRHVGECVTEKLRTYLRLAVGKVLKDLEDVKERLNALRNVDITGDDIERMREYLAKRVTRKSLRKVMKIIKARNVGTLLDLWIALTVAGLSISKSNLSDGKVISRLAVNIFRYGSINSLVT